MKVAFYKGNEVGGVYDKVISYWISGKYSHVELWTSGGWRYVASPTHGVACIQEPVNIDEWDVIDIGYRFPDAEFNAAQLIGCKYDYLGVFGFVFRPARGKDSRWFCSEFIAHCLGFSEPWRYDPAILYDILNNDQL